MRFYLALFWVVVIAVLHAIPGSDLAVIQFDDLFQIDKFFHALVFAIGVWLAAKPMQRQYPKHWQRLIVVIYLLYGVLLEVCQGVFFKERHADVLDWIADAVGVLLALWIVRRSYSPLAERS